MRIALACVLCLAVTSVSASYWSVDLEPKTLKRGNDLWDIVYITQSGYQTGEIFFNTNTQFDLTTHENWALSKQCTDNSCTNDPTIKLTCEIPCEPKLDTTAYNHNIEKIYAASGRIELLTSDRGSDTIEIEDQQFTKIPILFNSKFNSVLAAEENKYAPYTIRSGYGLANVDASLREKKDNQNNNFIKQIAHQANEVSQQQVSFYFGKNIERIMFGGIEKYFAKGEFETFRNSDTRAPKQWTTVAQGHPDATLGLNLWSLEVKGINVNSQLIEMFPGKKTHAFFDSTSQFIYVPQKYLNGLITKINTNGNTYCTDQNDGSVLCQCGADINKHFPVISFTFFNQLSKNDVSNQYNLRPEHYLIPLERPKDGKGCIFAFRHNMVLGTQNNHKVSRPVLFDKQSDTADVNENTAQSEYYIWIGTAFMRAFYVAFDQQNNSIHIAESYDATTTDLKFGETFHYVLIVLGIALFLAATWILLSILKKVQTITVPQRPPQSYSLTSPVQIQPVAQYGYLPQQPLYRQY